MTPAPPRVWPRWLLKPTTGMLERQSPKARERAANSPASLSGVPVAWAAMRSMSFG
jgi:hypothetical protein